MILSPIGGKMLHIGIITYYLYIFLTFFKIISLKKKKNW